MRAFCDCCKQEEKEQFYNMFIDIPTGRVMNNPLTGQTKEEIIRKEFNLCRACFAGIYSMFSEDRLKFPKLKGLKELTDEPTTG